jgi:hypothetical protein
VTVSLSAAMAAMGTTQTATFICGSGVAALPGPQGNPYPVSGCYDVKAQFQDATAGGGAAFASAICASIAVPLTGSVDCGAVTNPICPVGSAQAPGGGCTTCPPGFHLLNGVCQSPPAGNTCPPGSTAIKNPGGAIIRCEAPLLADVATASNEVQLSFNLSTPHVYAVVLSGDVPTAADGSCPTGLTFVENAHFVLVPGGTTYDGPACSFRIRLQIRSLEVTRIAIANPQACAGSIGPTPYFVVVGQGCLSVVQVFGTLVIKVGVNCDDGSEPATGASAVPDGFPAGSIYECIDNALSVANIPVPDAPLTLTTGNAILNPACFPLYAQPTPTPTPSGTVVGTPLATPRPTETSTPGGTPTPVPLTSGSMQAYCAPPGPTTAPAVTGANGIVNFFGTEAEFDASAHPSNPASDSTVTIVGHFSIDGVPLAGVPMYAHYNDATGFSQVCGPVTTDATGTAACTVNSDSSPPGQDIPVDVDFILNCEDYFTHAVFSVDATPGTTPVGIVRQPAPNGTCTLRTGPGVVTLRADYRTTVDTQPPVTTGDINIGQYGAPTPSPVPVEFTPTPAETPTPATVIPMTIVVPTSPPTPTPTETPTPAPTDTPTPTETPTLTPTPTATSTPTVTPTPVPKKLSFSVNAARVSALSDRGDLKGLDTVTQGQRVNLMVYYTVKSMPKNLPRHTTYEIDEGSRVIFKAEFSSEERVQDVGRLLVRFIPYSVPPAQPPDIYVFRATLTIGTESQARTWTFAVTRRAVIGPP